MQTAHNDLIISLAFFYASLFSPSFCSSNLNHVEINQQNLSAFNKVLRF